MNYRLHTPARIFIFILIFGIHFLPGCSSSDSRSDLSITHLRTEYLENPLGIHETAPRFSWELHSTKRGMMQGAYRLLVASTPELLGKDQGDIWDSGKIQSDQNNQVVYAGQTLNSRDQGFWKVKAWDQQGFPSAWSEPAHWSMGLLHPDDWKAQWIGFNTDAFNEDPELMLPPSPYLRKEFDTENKIASATLYVSALGLYDIYINGQRVSEDYFTPGWTDYNQRVYHQTYDVSDLIDSGENALTSVLSNGWFAGYLAYALFTRQPRVRAFYGDSPALLAQLEITYLNGEKSVIVSDESWKASTGPLRSSDILMGETYDARLEMPGWDQPGFDDRSWVAAQRMPAAKGLVQAHPGVPVRITEEIATQTVTEREGGKYIFDLGQNFAGKVRLKVKGNPGDKIVLRFGEMLHPDGRLMTENLRKARATDTYILKGDPTGEVWESQFTYHGFQFVEVSGYTGKPNKEAITGLVMGSATPLTSTFSCSNDMVNQLYSNIVWTQRANYFEVPTDCPQRDERLGWTGDAQTYVRSATYNADVASFFTKWMIDLEDAQHQNGAYPNFAPLPFYRPKMLYSPAWMEAGIICPYTIYKVYGDTRIIERHFDSMKKFMDFHENKSVDNWYTDDSFDEIVPRGGWGDWLAVGAKTPTSVIATSYFAYSAKLMAEMAEAIGRDEDAKHYAQLFIQIKQAFQEHLMDAEGQINGHTQTNYTMAIYFELLDKDQTEQAGQYLVDLIKANDGKLATGFLGAKPLLPALSKTGRSDIAYDLFTQTTYPSWGFEVANGATSIWERWNSYTKGEGFVAGMNSFSHYAFGAVCEWMFDRMAGIDTEAPGYKQILIRPDYGDGRIDRVSASYHSIQGRISSSWLITGETFKLEVEIPVNTTAKIFVPAQAGSEVLESGKAPTEGVRFLERSGMYNVYEVGSGRYEFESEI